MWNRAPLLDRRHFLGAIGGFAVSSFAARAQAAADITFALSSNSFSTVSLRMAGKLGIFARHGINARFITMDNANASLSALLGGSAQIAVAGPGEALAAKTRGQDIYLVGNAYRGLSSVVVISKAVAERSGVKPDAPLKERLQVLNGLTFASPSPTAVFGISVVMAVSAAGGKMKLAYIGQTAMPAALESGAVQAMVAGSPFWVTPVARGAGVVWINCAAGELPYDVTPTSSAMLQTTKAFAQAQPAIMSGIHAALNDISALVTQQQDTAMKTLAEIYPDLDGKVLAVGFAAEWKNWAKPVVTEDDVRHDIDVLKASGQNLPGLDTIDPRSLISLG